MNIEEACVWVSHLASVIGLPAATWWRSRFMRSTVVRNPCERRNLDRWVRVDHWDKYR